MTWQWPTAPKYATDDKDNKGDADDDDNNDEGDYIGEDKK